MPIQYAKRGLAFSASRFRSALTSPTTAIPHTIGVAAATSSVAPEVVYFSGHSDVTLTHGQKRLATSPWFEGTCTSHSQKRPSVAICMPTRNTTAGISAAKAKRSAWARPSRYHSAARIGKPKIAA